MEEILFLDPVFKHNIWGGSKLRDDFGYQIDGEDIGECWGIAAHENGDCHIKNGKYAGQKLSQLWKEHQELFGNVGGDKFPLLIKIIDAKDDLSIQVHPDDAYAKLNEGGSLGKTECWYVIDCPRDASLVIGHNASSKSELAQMIEDKDWKGLIRQIPVHKGDFIQINPGTVHAIKAGFLILETQQNSDVTYRLYDYDRLSNGKPRELHIDKSIDVINAPAISAKDSVIDASDFNSLANQLKPLYECEYYKVFKMEVQGKNKFKNDYPFMLFSVLEGQGQINGRDIKKGDHFIIPSGVEMIEIEGYVEAIASTV
ncbi:MAG: mannose-6-phosphate isomerase, class I [Pseudobutyrivibrio sp.]|nr:mannose-6-phosphate isomerase, class I [Pseudobutyrivibrio sp.]